jgi:hypothetical protein
MKNMKLKKRISCLQERNPPTISPFSNKAVKQNEKKITAKRDKKDLDIISIKCSNKQKDKQRKKKEKKRKLQAEMNAVDKDADGDELLSEAEEVESDLEDSIAL